MRQQAGMRRCQFKYHPQQLGCRRRRRISGTAGMPTDHERLTLNRRYGCALKQDRREMTVNDAGQRIEEQDQHNQERRRMPQPCLKPQLRPVPR